MEMTWLPRKYRMCKTSHPFFCVREDAVASKEVEKVHDITSFFCLREVDVASQEVEKVHDITSFFLLAESCRGLPGSGEGARHHILSLACGKMS
jgi:hypothetical protein